MEKAAAHLTPVSLELGGKEPLHRRQHGENPAGCTADCIRKIFKLRTDVCRAGLCSCGREREGGIIKGAYPLDKKMYGDALENADYGRIVNKKHFERVRALIDEKHVVFGGEAGGDAANPSRRYCFRCQKQTHVCRRRFSDRFCQSFR